MMKKNKVAKDELSIDVGTNRHKWEKGQWFDGVPFRERIDTCKVCACERHTISFIVNGKRWTEVSHYVRSGIHIPPSPAPACWGGLNPK